MYGLCKYLWIVCLFILAGCVTEPVSDTPTSAAENPLNKLSIASVKEASFQPDSGAVLSWHQPVQVIVEDASAIPPNADQAVQKTIEQHLFNKGYRWAAPGQASDYQVRSVVAVGKVYQYQSIKDVMMIYPELTADEDGFEKGLLAISITRPGMLRSQWRGAIEVFAAGERLTDQEKQQRLHRLVASLLKSVPEPSDNSAY